MFDANFMIAAFGRTLIKQLSDPLASEEKRNLYIEDFKDCIKSYGEKTSEENLEELQSIKDYMECLIQYANDSKQLLTILNGIESENENDQKRNKFISHLLADKKTQIGEMMEMMDITLEVVNLGMEELEKYLPSTPNTEDQKKLQNLNKNISE